MDDTDRKILSILEEDGRASYTSIANELNVSEGTVRNRVNHLKQENVIEKFTVDLNDNRISAVVMAKLSTSTEMEKLFEELPEDLKLLEITGEFDVVVELSRESSEELNNSLDKIRGIEGVLETQTYSVLKERER